MKTIVMNTENSKTNEPNRFKLDLTDKLNTLTMMNTVNTGFSFVEVWFTDQTIKALEIEDNVNLTLIIG